MKKTYETPCADKIAFNYRDQVVAASGGSGSEFARAIWSNGCNIQNLIALSYDVCSSLPWA